MAVDALTMSYALQHARDIFDSTPATEKPANPVARTEMICEMAARIYKLKKEGK